MVLSSKRIVIYLAITLCIMVCLIQQGEGQLPIPTAASCLKSITGLPGCFTALNLIVLYNNTRYLTLDCCRAVNDLSDMCSIVLFPTQPQAIYRLKSICSIVKTPSPPTPSSSPPSSGSSPPSSGGATPSPPTSSGSPPSSGGSTPSPPSSGISPPSSGGSTPSPPSTSGGRPPSSVVPSASPRPSATPFFQ